VVYEWRQATIQAKASFFGHFAAGFDWLLLGFFQDEPFMEPRGSIFL
jgi:hypothetical protein